MSSNFTIHGHDYYLPKQRIRRKVEKVRYRARYEARCRQQQAQASYNSMGKLCWVERFPLLSLVSSLFGDPKAARKAQIQRLLETSW